MPRKLTGLRYLGGKSAYGTGAGKWIAEMLPYRAAYIEPFAGMCGVLLQRKKCRSEIINDTSGRIVNWWRTVRDQPEEFARFLELTCQTSRDEYLWAIGTVDNGAASQVERATAFTILINNAISMTGDANYTPGKFTCNFMRANSRIKPDKIMPLFERMRDVTIENCDAVYLLKKTVKKDQVVIYCDPPYRDEKAQASTGHYNSAVDYEALEEVLLAQKGAVAISGYAQDWVGLEEAGWHRHEMEVKNSAGTFWKSEGHSRTTDKWVQKRTEVLWTNYEPEDEILGSS